ncbi:hypothetical protein [Pontibacter burrus]|uniref:Uncharacterized protein n=1 Tax=Pontibacter burrus TaxID=2704466 RepID=A0A6B3LMV0_9BACT|nr:hypothetical protein [Pontibacter burrus]NEM96395.1 hypothetical protein [Pontibacter burrus]
MKYLRGTILLICLILFSCTDTSKLKEQEEQIADLKAQLEAANTNDKSKNIIDQTSTKYTLAVIQYKTGPYTSMSSSGETGFLDGVNKYVYLSEIEEIEDRYLTDIFEHKTLDKLEISLRNEYEYIHSVTSRKFYKFNTYVEASKFRRTLVD